MNNTINGKTPEEIKKGLEYCPLCNKSCPYHNEKDCYEKLHYDTLALVNQLQEDKKQLERERDAAVEQLRKGGRACSTCKFAEDTAENNEVCEDCKLVGTKLLYSNWEWDGGLEVE